MGEYEHHPDRRYELLVSEIRNLDPDILAIQEANPLPYYVERLAADLNYQAIYRVALGGIRFGSFGIPTNMREGQAILVKKPWTITKLGRKRLSGGGIATNWFSFSLSARSHKPFLVKCSFMTNPYTYIMFTSMKARLRAQHWRPC